MSTPAPGRHMRAEMARQPDVIEAMAARRDALRTTVQDLLPTRLRGVVLVARGSSDNAALHARYLIERHARVPVVLAAPSLQTRYGVVPDLEDFLVVAVSQSGRTPEIVDAVDRLTAGAAGDARRPRTLAITNGADSPLAAACDATIALEAGEERAVPATVTFTAQVAALAIVAEALGARDDEDVPGLTASDWSDAVSASRAVLADTAGPSDCVPALRAAKHVLPVARGLLYAAAVESGLKLAETTGLPVRGTSSADLQHGPIATAREGTVALCFTTQGPTAGDMREIIGLLRDRGATVIGVGPGPRVEGDGVDWLDVPGTTSEDLAILPSVIRGQQLALAVSLAEGIDPDAPFALSKVTATR